MADTVFRALDVEPVACASEPAAEYVEYKALRNRFQSSVPGQLGLAIKASMLATLDGVHYPVKFRNQGALAGISAQLLRGPLRTHGETVNVFLCLSLKNTRKEVNTEHSAAFKRLTGVGPKKHAKLQRSLDNLYDHITVGPVVAPAILLARGVTGIRAPPWRRGHFRAQPCDPARSSRKLIFVAPILIHADRLDGRPPPPKAYELTTGLARNDVAVSGAMTQRIQPARFPADSRQPLARAFRDRT